MLLRFAALAIAGIVLGGCQTAGSAPSTSGAPTAEPVASPTAVATDAGASASAAPTDEPAPPPAAVARVTVLPASSGPLGSTWLLTLTGFRSGAVITETITNPNGIPKSALVTAGVNGSASVTFQTQLADQPGVGKYIFRFVSGATSITTTIEVTKAQ